MSEWANCAPIALGVAVVEIVCVRSDSNRTQIVNQLYRRELRLVNHLFTAIVATGRTKWNINAICLHTIIFFSE